MHHILFSRNEPRPWWPADQRLDLDADQIIIPDCCLCKMPAREIDCRLMAPEIPLGGVGDYQYPLKEWQEPDFVIPYDAAHFETRCAVDCGCKVKPRRRSSRHLRESFYEYA